MSQAPEEEQLALDKDGNAKYGRMRLFTKIIS